jgi:pyridoxamine 5'-phosphate oxidase
MTLHAADAARLADALSGACVFRGLTLPDPLPPEPMGLFVTWLTDAGAAKTQPNPNAMTLATVDWRHRPAARIVLCRGVDEREGRISFYTNYQSRKGHELTANPFACAVFHWDHLERQVRIEGPVTRSPEAESDAYFAGRPALSRVAAWASDQSRPLASRQALIEKNAVAEARFGVRPGVDPQTLAVPRPPHWGGFRLWAAAVELWLGHPNRLHDRARWERDLTPDTAAGFTASPWRVTRLEP